MTQKLPTPKWKGWKLPPVLSTIEWSLHPDQKYHCFEKRNSQLCESKNHISETYNTCQLENYNDSLGERYKDRLPRKHRNFECWFVQWIVDKHLPSPAKDIESISKAYTGRCCWHWSVIAFHISIESNIQQTEFISARMCHKLKVIFLLKNKKRIYPCFLLPRIVIEDSFQLIFPKQTEFMIMLGRR